MSGLKAHKATGPDGIPPRILKELATELAPVFTLLFNASLKQGIVPRDWRMAHVAPIFKKGDSLLPSNYRPVSLTSIPCKILEHIVHSNMIKHLLEKNILCDHQHGFRKLRSCETQLISFINDLARNMANCFETHAIFLDFAKAFDKVNHLSLIKKMKHYGITGNTLNWVRQFLADRTQQVLLEGVLSEPASVLSGVPQGTVLGPLLFLIYINDLPKYVSEGTQVRLFADDSAVYRIINTPEDHKILQKDIEGLVRWEQEWSMSFHPEKCQLLRVTAKRNPVILDYKIHGVIIEPVKDAKYLGVTICDNLSWSKHITNICTKAKNTINFLQRNFKTCPPHIKARLYATYVRPTLEYCSSVWDPHTDYEIEKLEDVQKRAARFVFNQYSRHDRVTPLLQKLEWVPLKERRARAKVTLFFKAEHKPNLVDIPTNKLTKIQSCTRQHGDFFIPFARTDTYKFSFYMNTIRLWNKLPAAAKSATSLADFQRALSTHTLRGLY